MISQTYILLIVNLVSIILQQANVQVAPGDLNTFVLVGVQVITAIWALIRKNQKGDISPLGLIK